MKFGIFIPLQLPRPWSDGDEQRLVHEALEQVDLADQLGLHCVWVQEHHFLEEYSHSSAPEVFLAACSQRTKQIRLGHGIVVMSPRVNPPARVAERVAMLDVISGGRVEWGTGESGTRMELEAFGVDFVDKRPMWAEAVREAARMCCMQPYLGFNGRYFSMPPRNVLPKPLQRPHPPLWAACSNRDSLKLVARFGMGALTFAFANGDEARFWVEEYYETFCNECVPIGRAVNPNIAMLTGFMCHDDARVARERGEEGAHFFAHGLGHYWRDGVHRPGQFDLWQGFQNKPASAMDAMQRERRKAGMGGIGSPAELIHNFREYEEAGVDQLVLLQQCGRYQHQHVCDSLRLFASEVLPEFKAREQQQGEAKQRRLDPYVAAAHRRMPPLETEPVVVEVEAYPRLWSREATADLAPDRRPGMAALWQMQVGGQHGIEAPDPADGGGR